MAKLAHKRHKKSLHSRRAQTPKGRKGRTKVNRNKSKGTGASGLRPKAHASMAARAPAIRLSGKHEVILPVSVVGGLLGMLAGTLPATVWVLVLGFSFPPLYALLPFFIDLGIRIFKGYTGKNAVIITSVFSAFGLYLTALSCQAALYVIKYHMLFLNVPLVTSLMIGKGGVLPSPLFSSANVFPLIFTVCGVLLVKELRMKKAKTDIPPAAVSEKEAD